MNRKPIKRIVAAILSVVMTIGSINIVFAGNSINYTNAIKPGEYLQMGRYYDEPILWRCTAYYKITGYDDNGNPIVDAMEKSTEPKDGYLPMMLSDRILCYKAFDAKGDNPIGSHGRNRIGYSSNYWGDSNIRDWLNSSESAGNVIWSCGNPPDKTHVNVNAYDQEAGFLSDFDLYEKNAIKTVTQKQLLYGYEYSSTINENYYHADMAISVADIVQNYATAYSELISDKIFLIDVKQVNDVYNDFGDYCMARPIGSNNNIFDYYWLRSPMGGHPDPVESDGLKVGVRYIMGTKYYNDSYSASAQEAHYVKGIRPAFFLNQESAIFSGGNGSEITPYVLSTNGQGEEVFCNNNEVEINSLNLIQNGKRYNVLNKKVRFLEGSEESVVLETDLNTRLATDIDITLIQDGLGSGNAVRLQNNSSVQIKPGQLFEAGHPLYLFVTDRSGNILNFKKVMIEVYKEEEEEPSQPVDDKSTQLGLDIFNTLSFKIDPNQPFVGDTEVKLSVGGVESNLSTYGDKFKMALGVNLNDENGEVDVKKFEEFKKDFKELKKNSKSFIKNFKKYQAGKGDNFTITDKIKGKGGVFAYIEGTYSEEKGYEVTEGELMLFAQASYTYKGQTFVGYIPIVYSVTLDLKSSGSLKCEKMELSGKPKWTGCLIVEPGMGIGAGPGIAEVLEAEVGGHLSMEFKFDIPLDDNPETTFNTTVTLKGHCNLKATVAGFDIVDWQFAEFENQIYPNTTHTHTQPLNYGWNQAANPMDRDYSKKPVVWGTKQQANNDKVSVYAVDYTNKDTLIMQTNAYPDAKPQTMSHNGAKVMIWTADDHNRNAYNKSMLVYSVYDEESNSWLPPEAVLDTGTNDIQPYAKDGYVIWSKADKEFSEGVTLDEIAESFDIYAAKFNGSGFDEPVCISNTDGYDFQPVIFASGSNVTAVWVKNSVNDMTGMNGTNAVYKSVFDGANWSKPELIADNITYITHIDAGIVNGEEAIAYVSDEDNDTSTIDDREIYIYKNGSATQFTNNDVIDSHPVFNKINNIPALFWYSNGNINYITEFDDYVINTVSAEDGSIFNDQFNVVSNGDRSVVLWTENTETGSEVCGMLYDDHQWSRDITFTDTGEAAKYPNGIIDKNGKVFITYNKAEVKTEGSEIKKGENSLCMLSFEPSYDISIDDVYYVDDIIENTELPMYVSVKNSGELPVSGYTVTLYEPDGSINNVYHSDTPLLAGETTKAEIIYKIGDTVTEGMTYAEISIDGDEYNEANNIFTYEIKAKIYGDVNLDGDVNSTDAKILLKYISGAIELDSEPYSRADINGDDKVDMLDVIEILNK